MPVKYLAYTWQGEKVEGVLPVDAEEEARQLLEQDHVIPYRITRVRARPSLVRLLSFLFRPQLQDLIDFTRGLATLLKAGIPLRQGLVVLRDQARSLGLKDALTQIIEEVESGRRFSEAASRPAGVFPGAYLRLLRVGEATGEMTVTLQQLAETLVKRKQTRDKVKSALLYPALSLALAVVAGFVLMTQSLPALTKLLSEFGGELPTATKALVAISDFLQTYQLLVGAALFGIPSAIWLYGRTSQGARFRDALLLKAPVIGGVLLNVNILGLISTFGLLLRAGIPVAESLRLCEEGVGNRVVREAQARVTKKISEGERLGLSFRDEPLFPSILSQGIITGEMTGSLPEILSSLAEYYENETTRAIAAATELIQPAVILLVAGAVGFVSVAVISGIYSTLGAIK